MAARIKLLLFLILLATLASADNKISSSARKVYYDTSVRNFVTERTCWWNEPCKKEFQRIFRCRCPDWAYCRSLGRYYAAQCSFTQTGYIWEQQQSSPRRMPKTRKQG